MGIAQISYRWEMLRAENHPKSHGSHPAIRTLWDPPTGIAYEINAAGHGLGVEKKRRGLGIKTSRNLQRI